MIKFIASDLDGTLLDKDKNLPKGIFSLVEKLYEKGILFAPASGRQYANLKKLFAPVADKVIFIAENGALVKFKEETVFSLPVEKKSVKPALDAIRKTDWARPVLCCQNCAYTETDEEPFFPLTKGAYTKLKKVESLDSLIAKNNVCKIAVFDKTKKADVHANELRANLPDLRTVVSGYEWFDISSPDVNKGVAIEQIRKAFGFTKEECMAFGDHMNDYEMLLACGRAFVPENGYPPLKEIVKNTIPSNEEYGVIKYLENMIKTTLA